MGYYISDSLTSLDDLQARIQATDLIPSHRPLLDGLKQNLDALSNIGVQSMADLRIRLKNKKSIESLVSDSGINFDYLVLLRRVTKGFFPKPIPFKLFDWIETDTVAKLEKAGVKNTLHLFELSSTKAIDLSKQMGIKENKLSELIALSDLSRVQWVSPTFARTLIAAGFNSVDKISKSDPEKLYDAILQANENARFYKGKIGLRDIKRLITAAEFVPKREF